MPSSTDTPDDSEPVREPPDGSGGTSDDDTQPDDAGATGTLGDVAGLRDVEEQPEEPRRRPG